MSTKFTDRVFNRVEPLWKAYLEHPFVKGIGEGDLEVEKFKHYLKQDYLYLIEYSTAAVLACAWSYNFIGKHLAEWPSALEYELYGNWVSMYSSEGFTKIANDCKELLNKITEGKPESELKELEEIVIQTSKFEY